MTATSHTTSETCQHGKPIDGWCGDCWVLSDTNEESKRAAKAALTDDNRSQP